MPTCVNDSGANFSAVGTKWIMNKLHNLSLQLSEDTSVPENFRVKGQETDSMPRVSDIQADKRLCRNRSHGVTYTAKGFRCPRGYDPATSPGGVPDGVTEPS